MCLCALGTRGWQRKEGRRARDNGRDDNAERKAAKWLRAWGKEVLRRDSDSHGAGVGDMDTALCGETVAWACGISIVSAPAGREPCRECLV